MKKEISIFILLLFGGTAWAQNLNLGVAPGSSVIPGPLGVYIYVKDSGYQFNKRTSNWEYIVLKEEKPGKGFNKIGNMHFPASASEMEKAFDKSFLQTLLQQRKLRNVQDMYNLLQSGRFDTLGLYLLSPEVMIALGLLYIDATVTKASPGISYRLNRIENGNGKTVFEVNLGNISWSPFPHFKQYKTVISDSSATIIWYATGSSALYASIFTDAFSGKKDVFKAASRQRLYKKSDTLFLIYFTPTPPGKKIQFYLRPEDIAGNRGQTSDTVRFLSLQFEDRISISNLSATDSSGSVWLKWDSLPVKAWLSGIEVLKSRFATADYMVIDTLPVSATQYRDRRIISGNMYYYQLRPILFELPQKGQITPSVVNVHTKATPHKIPAPQGLEIKSASKESIALTWLPNADLDIFAYYILRGTSTLNLQVISPAIRDTVFSDSLKGLNTGITYLYAVAAVDMNMHWSDTSSPIALQSPLGKLVTSPAGIQARSTSLGVRLSWPDVSLTDPSVLGYLLYRRKKGDQYFTQLNKQAFSGNYFTDSSALPAGDYEYGCSSLDAWNHVSILSPLASVHLGEDNNGTDPLYAPSIFGLRNIPEGIEIALPATIHAAGEKMAPEINGKYILYRRLVTQKTFQKIGEIPAGSLSFIDRKVVKDQLYVYVLTLQRKTEESSRSEEKSLRRK